MTNLPTDSLIVKFGVALLFSIVFMEINGNIDVENWDGVQCGVAPNRSVKTAPLDFWDWPWIVAVGNVDGKFFRIESTGVLVSKRHVLTSKLRIRSALGTINQINYVRVGEYDFKTDLDDTFPDTYYIAKVYQSQFSFDGENDVVLLELERDVVFSDYVRPVCLPENITDSDLNKKKLKATTYSHYVPDIKEVLSIPFEKDVYMLQRRTCVLDYSDVDFRIDNRFLCGGSASGGPLNSCFGEIGAPVHYQDPETGYWMVVGLLTTHNGCAGTNDFKSSSLIMNVTYYLPFIKESMEKAQIL